MRLKSLAWPVSTPLAAVALLVLTGCAPMVQVSAAEDSNNPACAPMMVALPDTLADAPKRTTSSQATAAWGEPSQIILRCGVPAPGPTTDACVTVNEVDWVIKEGDPAWTLTTYGRSPATEIVFDPDVVPSSSVLPELANAAAKIPATRACVSTNDLQLPAG